MVEVLSKSEALRFIEQHQGLLDHPSNPQNPFAGSAWTAHFVSEVISPSEKVIAVSTPDHSGVMLLKGVERGGVLSGLSNYYSSLYSPLSSNAPDRVHVATHLCEALTRHRPTIASVKLSPLDPGSEDVGAVASACRKRGWFVRDYFSFGNWYLPCEGVSFDHYWDGRESQLKNTHRRKAKKLLAAGTLELISNPADVEAGMDAFDAVYRKSWKTPEPFPNFVRGWAHVCAQHGWLRLGLVRLGDTPIAAQFWFTIGGRAYIFKLAYDEEHANWSAGTVLTAHLFRHALDVDRVIEVDYLTGDDPYKKTWMTHRRERRGLMLCNPRSPRGLLSAAREWGGAVTSQLRKPRTESVVSA